MIHVDPIKDDIDTPLHVYIYKRQHNHDYNTINRYRDQGLRELHLFIQHV